MLTFVVFYSFVLIFGVRCKLEVQEVTQNLDKALKFLEGKKTVNTNASMLMSWGASELYNTLVTTPKLPAGRPEMIQGFINRFSPFVAHAADDFPSDFVKFMLTNPQWWGHEMEYKHQAGRITPVAITDNLADIIKKSIATDESDACILKLLEENKASLTPRTCKQVCKEKMYDTAKFDGGLPVDERIIYVVYDAILNCTNANVDFRTKAAQIYCNYLMGQVNSLEKMPDDDKMAMNRYYYLNKLLVCGTFGFPEFFSENRVRALMKAMNPDGSTGTKANNPEDVVVLTTQVAVVLAGSLRMLTEMGQ